MDTTHDLPGAYKTSSLPPSYAIPVAVATAFALALFPVRQYALQGVVRSAGATQ